MKPDSDRSVENARGYSPRTTAIIQVLMSSREPKHYEEIAKKLPDSEKTPFKRLCKSVHKTLMRLFKKGYVLKPSNGFFMLNHDNPADFLPCVGKCRWGVSFVGLHRVGLRAVVEGGLLGGGGRRVKLRSGVFVSARSVVYGASLQLREASAYYQLSSEPFGVDRLPLLAEDFLRGIPSSFEVKDLFLNDFERGVDVPYDTSLLNFAGVSHIIIYVKRGLVRIHALHKAGDRRIPLSKDAQLKIETDTFTAFDEAQNILTNAFPTLLRASP